MRKVTCDLCGREIKYDGRHDGEQYFVLKCERTVEKIKPRVFRCKRTTESGGSDYIEEFARYDICIDCIEMIRKKSEAQGEENDSKEVD